MAEWLNPAASLRSTRVLTQNGDICGFATWRACREGTKIGPVVANDTGAAIELIADVAAERPDGPLIIDIPETNRALRQEILAAGFEVPFATARMYRGPIPEQHHSLQAIATMELG